MRKSAADITFEKLIDEGWSLSHTATVNEYRTAGTVSPMKSRNGFDYCRIHHGKTVTNHSYQITTVMKRKQETH